MKMRLYHTVSGVLFILPIIDFAVAAPVRIREKLQVRVNEVRIPATTMLGTRGSGLDELLLKPFRHPFRHSPSEPGLSDAHPSSSLPLSVPTDVSTDFEQPPSISEQPSQLSYPDHTPPIPGPGGDLKEMWLNLIGHPGIHPPKKPEESSAARPSPSTGLSGADESIGAEQSQSPILEEPSPVSGPHRAPPSQNNKNEPWLELFGSSSETEDHSSTEPDESSPANPSSSSRPLGPAGGSMDVDPSQLSILEEPSLVSSTDHAPLGVGDEYNKMWLNLIGHPEIHSPPKPGESSATPSLPSSEVSGPSDGLTDPERTQSDIFEEPLPVSNPDHALLGKGVELNELWRNLMESHLPENPEKSSAARLLSSSQPLGPAGVSMDVGQPQLSTLEEPSPVSGLDPAPLGTGNVLDKMWFNLIGPKPVDSSATHPPSSSELLGPSDGQMDAEQPPQPTPIELSPTPSPEHVTENQGRELNAWFEIFDKHRLSKEQEASSAAGPWSSLPAGPAAWPTNLELSNLWFDFMARPENNFLLNPEELFMSSSSRPSGLADEPMEVEQQQLTSPAESSPVSNPYSEPADWRMKTWFNIENHFSTNPENLLATLPSSSSQPSRFADGSMDVEQALPSSPKEPPPVSGPRPCALRR